MCLVPGHADDMHQSEFSCQNNACITQFHSLPHCTNIVQETLKIHIIFEIKSLPTKQYIYLQQSYVIVATKYGKYMYKHLKEKF